MTHEELAILRERRGVLLARLSRAAKEVTEVQQALTALDLEEALLARAEREPWVLVCGTVGAPPTTYHDSVNPCGHVKGKGRNPELFQQVRLGKALRRGLKPCRTCRPAAAT